MANIIKQIEDKEGNKVLPITHVDAVRDSAGTTLPEILDRDYPTTSKTPVEGSTEVSLVTRGEKYEWNKVGNAADASSASDITSNFKYLLLNGSTGEFETALKAYVEESVRAALGPLINNLDKGTGIKALAGIDANNDLGSITTANLASVLSAILFTYNTGNGLISTFNIGGVESAYHPNNATFGIKIYNQVAGNWIYIGFPSGGGNSYCIKNGDNNTWRVL